jgi:hypothetical protein
LNHPFDVAQGPEALEGQDTKGTKEDLRNFWFYNVFRIFDSAVLGALGVLVVQRDFGDSKRA